MASAALSNTRSSGGARPRNKPNNLPNRQYQNNYQNRRETPEPEPSRISPQGLYNDPRTAMIMCSFMGTRTTVKTTSGNTYKGHTTGFSEKGDIALCDARLEDEDNNSQNPVIPGIIIHKDRFVVCKTNGVDLKSICSGSDFTDSAIASRSNGSSTEGQLRQLQPWQDDDAQDINPNLSLDDKNGGWEAKEMFAVNNEKFNVQSSFNEDMNEYTTKLPDPNSEGYEERQRFAQKQAEEIERSEAYQNRIAKELNDGDEENRFSAVHRSGESQQTHRSVESNNAGGKNPYTIPALRGDGEQSLKNGLPRNQARQFQRQVSPLSASSQQSQQHPHHHSQNPRPINNHYQGPPPSSNVPLRNQGPPVVHRAQASQNHSVPPTQLQFTQQQPPPPPHSHTQPPAQQHQRPAQQLVSPTQHVNSKSQPHPPHQQSSPANIPLSSLTQQAPPQHQVQNKMSPPNSQAPQTLPNAKSVPAATNINGPLPQNNMTRPQNVKQINGDGPNNIESPSQKHLEAQLAGPVSAADSQQVPRTVVPVSPPSVLSNERRVGRGMETLITSPEERKKSVETLKEFKRNFNLSNDNRQEEPVETVPMAAAPVASTAPVNLTPEVVSPHIEPTEFPHKPLDKTDEEEAPTDKVSKSTLNPNAKEFRPKVQTITEAQSPSPQPRSSPHIQQPMVYYNPVMVQYPMVQNTSRKRATVSLNHQLNTLSTVPDLSHVTGQPLLATQPVVLMPSNGQQGYPFRMFSPGVNSIALAQGGQHIGIDQGSQQGQPQTVFMAAPTQPMPAHLAPHPQPAHSQPHPSSNQAPQPTHVPNPAPSPVQQHNSQQMQQQLAHHMSQVPPQSLTPQPAHFPQMNLSYAIPAMPRTTVSGQQGISAAHPTTVSIGYPVSQYPYPNGNPAQYPFAPAAHPQTSQNSSHGQGPQPQYVMMPSPHPQGHPPMQQNPQPYPAGIQFQPQHNIMQGPPQMPPNMGPNPNQGGHHIIHSPMPGIHQQVSSSPSMYMPAAPQFYVPREGSRSSTAVSAPTIMFTWP
ncbi:ataxin-2-like isoform X2 [Biomphalaria glabrata]|uniref:Ataxin-2-like isoform X2 n=1 Tax=Biomphalaria glabrata TaxID=6526 RepID=A0A9W2YG62_BIOGL|nr:ataxin-2-like isoform X2 [Biomphalaria glabrata]